MLREQITHPVTVCPSADRASPLPDRGAYGVAMSDTERTAAFTDTALPERYERRVPQLQKDLRP